MFLEYIMIKSMQGNTEKTSRFVLFRKIAQDTSPDRFPLSSGRECVSISPKFFNIIQQEFRGVGVSYDLSRLMISRSSSIEAFEDFSKFSAIRFAFAVSLYVFLAILDCEEYIFTMAFFNSPRGKIPSGARRWPISP